MKLFNISFHVTQKAEAGFLAYRHSIDSMLFCTMHRDFDITHIKLAEKGFVPNPANDELFFGGQNRFFHVPYRLCLHIKKQQPEIVIVHGFLFPFQVMVLKLFLPAKTKLIVQHHAEQPFRNRIKRWLQRRAYGQAEAYFFSSEELSAPFIIENIITEPGKITEVPESSTLFEARDIAAARQPLDLSLDCTLFLWVGRLDNNKDPLTVLKAFAGYLEDHPGTRLYMFYHEDAGLEEVRASVAAHQLEDSVFLMGHVRHEALEAWYNACDFFLSGSHYESTGYALCEAMACGCIPVVTAIPAFKKISAQGEFAVLYAPGDAGDLLEKLKSLDRIEQPAFRKKVIQHFKNELSFEALSGKIKAKAESLLQE